MAETAAREESSANNASRGAWLLVGLLWFGYCLNYADRQVVFSIFPPLKAELNFTDTQLGLTSSMFLWVYALCSPAAGLIGDRFSKKALVTISLVLWSTVTALTGFSTSPVQLLAGRGLIGVTESLFYPCAVALLADAHPPETRSRAFALFNSGNIAGVILGGSLGGLIAEKLHWRWAFYFLGALGALYAAPFAAALRRRPSGSGVADAEARAPSGDAAGRGPLLPRVPTFWVLCIVYSAFTFTAYLFYTWLPAFLVEKFSLGLAEAGFTATAYGKSASIAGLLAGGWGADWLFRRTKASRLWVLAAACSLSAPFAYCIGIFPTLGLTKLAALGYGFCEGMFIANMFAAAMEVIPPARRASAVGLLNLVGASVSGFAGFLGGFGKARFGIAWLMTQSALACLAAGLVLVGGIRMYFRRDYVNVNRTEELSRDGIRS